ncbi:MAG TPA: hypothetical protein PKC58_17785 [Ignavibacteria bacterium]|nr:hypothetical protein [Ignavibacteria bacterium]
MKNLFSLIFIGLFVCCTSNVTKDVDSKASNLISATPRNNVDEVLCAEDSLVKVLLKNGVETLQGGELINDPDIKFTSGYSDDFSFTRYQLSYKEINIDFIDTVYEKSKVDKRNLYLNNKRLNVCNIKSDAFNLDSMEVHVVYTESEIYAFRNNPFYLLIVSHPMNWVGRMTSFSFFQLINLKEKTVVEFIREEE